MHNRASTKGRRGNGCRRSFDALRFLPWSLFGIWCLSIGISGCSRGFGTGGTGETVVPAERLRRIDDFDLERYARTGPPQTMPTTGPTRGVTEPTDAAAATQPATS